MSKQAGMIILAYGNVSIQSADGILQGKVRDVYTIGDRLLVMVASDRISAFDVVLPHPIPFKGQVLNQLAALCWMPVKTFARTGYWKCRHPRQYRAKMQPV